MSSFRPHSTALSAALAWLAAGLLTAGCADKSNPVLSPSGGPGGVSSSNESDGGMVIDGEPASSDARADGSPHEEVASDTLTGGACNLLTQEPCTADLGCYPVAGAGRCLIRGGRSALSPCLEDTDCDRGLVCRILTDPGAQGLCEPICALSEYPATVCPNQVCGQRSDFPEGIGACLF
jgi:hypothetical protein